jgi:hypothetical protein
MEMSVNYVEGIVGIVVGNHFWHCGLLRQGSYPRVPSLACTEVMSFDRRHRDPRQRVEDRD